MSRVRYTLKKSEILRGRKNFRKIFDEGKRIEGNILRCLVLADTLSSPPASAHPVFGVVVSRTIRRAVDRNLVKRRIREAYRLNKHMLDAVAGGGSPPGTLVFAYFPRRKNFRIPAFDEIEHDLKSLLMKALKEKKV